MSSLLSLPRPFIFWLAAALILAGILLNDGEGSLLVRFSRISSLTLTLFLVYLLVSKSSFVGLGASHWVASLGSLPNVSQVWEISTLLFFVFIGWENLSVGIGNVKGGKAALRWAYALSYLLVVALYLLIALMIAGSSLTPNGPSTFANLIKQTQFTSLLVIVSLLILLSNCGAWLRETCSLVCSAANGNGNKKQSLFRNRRMCLLMTVFLFLILAQSRAWVNPSFLIKCANQNFAVIYLASLFAFAKLELSPLRWVLVGAASLSIAFLLSGVGWQMLYPLALILVGYVHHNKSLHSHQNSNHRLGVSPIVSSANWAVPATAVRG